LQKPQTPEADQAQARARLIASILQAERPIEVFAESMESAIHAVQSQTGASAATQGIKARRLALQAMPLEDLRALHSALLAKQAKEAEAKRFYNQPKAMADYNYWLGMDFWSLDEAVVLLTKRDPREVNRQTIDEYLAPKKGLFAGRPNEPTPFTQFYRALRLRAERSNAMTHSERLTPVEVIRWAKGVMGPQVPAPLLAYLDGQPALSPPEEARQESPATAPETTRTEELRKTKVKRAALMRLENIWPTVANDLQHANRNGLAKAAKSEDYSLWWEESALHWARLNGRLSNTPPASSLQALPKRINRLE